MARFVERDAMTGLRPGGAFHDLALAQAHGGSSIHADLWITGQSLFERQQQRVQRSRGGLWPGPASSSTPCMRGCMNGSTQSRRSAVTCAPQPSRSPRSRTRLRT